MAATYAGNEAAARQFQIETGLPVYKFDVADWSQCEKGVAQIAKDLGPGLKKSWSITPAYRATACCIHHGGGELGRGDPHQPRQRVPHDAARDRGHARAHFGRIISISSINGRKGQLGQANYAAAKAGLLGFTKAVALENANRGITANVIAPGYINTEMVAAVPKEVLDTKILPLTPVGRLGTAEEIARCVTFLAADEAGFITGACLDANGGQYMA